MEESTKESIFSKMVKKYRDMYIPTEREFQKTQEAFEAFQDWEWDAGLKKAPTFALIKELLDRLLDAEARHEAMKKAMMI